MTAAGAVRCGAVSKERAALECVAAERAGPGRNASTTPPSPPGRPIAERRPFQGARGVPNGEKQTVGEEQNRRPTARIDPNYVLTLPEWA